MSMFTLMLATALGSGLAFQQSTIIKNGIGVSYQP